MSSGPAPICVPLEESSGSNTVETNVLLGSMLGVQRQVSDLIFSPGRVPQLQSHGELIPFEAPGIRPLTADDTRRVASDLIGTNKHAIGILREQGSCDVSFGLPGLARFRVNVFIQRGSCAVVMHVIPSVIPDLASLGLPLELQEAAGLRDGIVLIAGPRNSGKSSTLAALLDCINQERVCHILTIEDPIEFLHNHKRATVHQRELHSDTPSFALGLRAAMRQAPDVIMVSDLADREAVEMVLEAAETGHLVLSSINTLDTAKTLERMAGFLATQPGARNRLAKTLRFIVSQRLITRKNGMGRIAVAEVVKFDSQLQKHLQDSDFLSHQFPQDPKHNTESAGSGLDQQIANLVRAGSVDFDTAIMHANDPERLRLALRDFTSEQ